MKNVSRWAAVPLVLLVHPYLIPPGWAPSRSVSFPSSPLSSLSPCGNPLAGDWEQASLGGKHHSPLLSSHVALVSQPPHSSHSHARVPELQACPFPVHMW